MSRLIVDNEVVWAGRWMNSLESRRMVSLKEGREMKGERRGEC
jgi:hypothetical protein